MGEKKSVLVFHYVMVYIITGMTYFFNKKAVATIHPMYVIAIRYIIGGIMMFLFVRVQGGYIRRPRKREIFSALFIGIFLFITGAGFTTIGLQYTDSYLTSLITSSIPLMVVCFDALLFRKRPKLMSILGVIIGMCGVTALMYDGTSVGFEANVGFIFILLGAASWSFASSIAHSIPVHEHPLVTSGMRMLFSGIICFFIAVCIAGVPSVAFSETTVESIWSMAFLAVVGSIAFNSYSYLIQIRSAQHISTYALVNPIIAILMGLVLGNEEAVPYLWLGMTLTLFGLLIHFYGERLLHGITHRLARKNGRANIL